MKANDFRSQSLEELEAKEVELRKDLFDLRNARSIEKKLPEPHKLNQTRKDLARVLSVMREKQLAS